MPALVPPAPPLALSVTSASSASTAATIARAFRDHETFTRYTFKDSAAEVNRAIRVPGVEKFQIAITSVTGVETPVCKFVFRRMSATDLADDALCKALRFEPAILSERGITDFVYLWKVGVVKGLQREVKANLVAEAVKHLESKFSMPIVAKVNAGNETTTANQIILNNLLKQGFEKIGVPSRMMGQNWQWLCKQPTPITPPVVGDLFPSIQWEKIVALDPSVPVSIVGRRADFKDFLRTAQFALLRERGNPIIFHEPVPFGGESSAEALVAVPGMRQQWRHLRVSSTSALGWEIDVRMMEASNAPNGGRNGLGTYDGGEFGADALHGPHPALIILLPEELKQGRACLDRDWIACAYSRIAGLLQSEAAALCFFGGDSVHNRGNQLDYYLRPLFNQVCRIIDPYPSKLDPGRPELPLSVEERRALIRQQAGLMP